MPIEYFLKNFEKNDFKKNFDKIKKIKLPKVIDKIEIRNPFKKPNKYPATPTRNISPGKENDECKNKIRKNIKIDTK